MSAPTSSQKERVVRMNDLLTHRGPDDEGIYEFTNRQGLMGHRRLSIQDLSMAGHQPMHSASGRFTIVFNGEIYNFKKLRKALLDDGVEFSSESDTEVILALLERFSLVETLKKLQGMFAFAVYDRENDRLMLARDPMGEKPLYYHFSDDTFLFSSELKPLLSGSDHRFALDAEGLQNYLHFGYVPGSGTVLQQVYKLLPGHTMILQCRGTSRPLVEVSSFVKDKPGSAAKTATLNEAVDQMDKLLQKSVDQQMISDVKLGSFLSGGIDSSLVSAVAQSQSNTPLETFTIGFNDKAYDEAPYAQAIAQNIGAESHVLYIGESDLLENVFDAQDAYDEPFANGSSIASYLLARFARKQVTVCLSGDGGDELFMGYNRYVAAGKLYDRLHGLPTAFKALATTGLKAATKANPDRWMQHFGSLTGRPTGVNYGAKVSKLADFASLASKQELYQYLTGYTRDYPISERFELADNVIAENFNRYDFDQDYVRAAMLWDQDNYLSGDCLYKSDRSAMASSIEVRVPLLDPDIVSFSRSLPVAIHNQAHTSKSILKSLLHRYVPEKLFERPKMGFTVPIDRWINKELAAEIDGALSNQKLRDFNVIDAEKVQVMLDEHRKGSRKHGNRLWAVFCLQRWLTVHREYLE